MMLTRHRVVSRRPPTGGPRPAAALVENALALPIVLLLLMGIFEYGRYTMMRNVLANAAREGARAAVVNSNDWTTADVQAVVLNYMGNQQGQLQNFSVQVYPVDASGNQTGTDWNSASFGSGIAVEIDGDYQPVIPKFLMMPSLVPMRAVAIMNSEAN